MCPDSLERSHCYKTYSDLKRDYTVMLRDLYLLSLRYTCN